jgi:phosphopantothenoylcysteine decarboxylase/phosphopantothenate--cysteine ligase
MSLAGKKIILAVTGSIAAYKTPELVRQLVKAGADVRVLTTSAALQFVSELSLATVSKHPVHSNVADDAAWNNHVELGRWADAMVVAPCSANTLAKMAHGLCDNLVNAVYLSAICPVFVAPAMDEDMWLHKSTRNNLKKLAEFGNHLLPVGHGELASGLVGEGRMAEPADIVKHLAGFFEDKDAMPLKGKKVLVTAGPTYERIDPVRFIGNFSSGKMGFALAEELAAKGATVTLVSGPVHLKARHAAISTIAVESAEQMYEVCLEHFPKADISILAAAVADYRPAEVAPRKIKKAETAFELALVRNKDILATLGSQKKDGQLLVGFALETDNGEQNAMKKLKEKNADLIVLNSLSDEGAGFGHDTNKITLVTANAEPLSLPLQTKKEAAQAIVNYILNLQDAEVTA